MTSPLKHFMLRCCDCDIVLGSYCSRESRKLNEPLYCKQCTHDRLEVLDALGLYKDATPNGHVEINKRCKYMYVARDNLNENIRAFLYPTVRPSIFSDSDT